MQNLKSYIYQAIPLAIFLAILILIPVLYSCADATSCSLRSLVWNLTFPVLDPVFIFAQWAIVPSIAVLFFRWSTFRSWLRFVAWAIPLSIIFIALIPVNSSGAYMDLFPFYRDDAARLAGEVFAAASLVLIIWRWWRTRLSK